MKHYLELNKISKVFSTEEVDTHALHDIDLTIHQGEFVSIIGQSGCGKSTLLSLIGLLDFATEGSYLHRGNNITSLNQKERALYRNNELGFVFQSFNLIADLTIFENVELPLLYRGCFSKAERKAKVEAALNKVEMLHRDKHFPSQLSGGQQQRVAIARAIVGEPSILLADEPTGNLDSNNVKIVLDILLKLNQEGTTIIMVTHEPNFSYQVGRVIELNDGKLIKDTPSPVHENNLAVVNS